MMRAAIYARLEAAYVAECESQSRKLAHEIAVAKKLLRLHNG
jgi:hypothetical protein